MLSRLLNNAGKTHAAEANERVIFRCVVLAILMFISSPLMAKDSLRNKIAQFDIPQQRADKSLIEFAEQADLTLIVPFDEVREITVNRLVGKYPIKEALKTLLSGTGLKATVGDSIRITIVSDQDQGKTMLIKKPATFGQRVAVAFLSIFGVTQVTGAVDTVEADSVSEQAATIEEVIVTARKRTEKLQDIPMSISVFSDITLERMGATEFFDVAISVPNLSFAYTGLGFNDSRGLAIRGVFGQGTTGLYIDDVPLPESIDPRIIGLERIEILRGPQGTLYGARSMGGAMRFITKQPDPEETSGQAWVGFSDTKQGDYNYSLNSELNIPLGDGMALRVGAFFEAKTGYFDRLIVNPATPDIQGHEKNINDMQARGAHLALRFDATDKLTITPQVWYQKLEHDGLPFADFRAGNFEDQVRGAGLPEDGEDEWVNSSLVIDYDSSIGTFVSATSLFRRDTFENEDMSEFIEFLFFAPFGASIILPAGVSRSTDLDVITQEMRFSSSFKGPLQFTGGVFYQDTKKDFDFPPGIVPGLDATFASFFGLPEFFGTDLVYEQDARTDTSELGIFGELSYDVNERLTLTTGLRWSDIKVDTSLVTGGIFGGPPIIGTQEENSFTPKFGIAYDVSGDLLIYANAAKGFRLGGVNLPLPSDCDQDLVGMGLTNQDLMTYDSDGLWNYDIGFKATHLDGRMTTSATGFFIDWSDIQQVIALPCGFNTIANAGSAESKGVEAEMAVLLAEGLNISLGVGYTDAQITDPGPNPTIEKGSRVFQVPKWTITFGGEYNFPVTPGWDGFVRADYRHVGDSYSANQDPTNPRVRPAYDIFNFRAGVSTSSTSGGNTIGWEVAFFIKNAFDEAANLADNRSLAAEDPRRPRIVTNQPRTFGVELRTRF